MIIQSTLPAELLKGNQPYQGVFTPVPALPANLSEQQQRVAESVMQQLNGYIVPYRDNKVNYIEKGYSFNDIAYMAIKLIVDKAILAPWGTYEVVDEAALKIAQAYRKQLDKPGIYVKYQAAINKALKPVKDDRLNERLQYPNPDSTLSKHHSGLWTYKLAAGEYYEKWTTASGGLNQGLPISLDVLPSQFMQIRSNMQIPARIIGYSLLHTLNIEYSTDDILHEAYFNPDWSHDGRQLYGMSPMKAALRRIQRNNESQQAGINMYRNGGVKGIGWLDMPQAALESDPLGTFTLDQASAIKLKYEQMARGGVDTAGSTLFSGYKVGFTEFGLSPVDLDQANVEKWDMRMIFGVWGVPSQLGNDPDNKTFSNSSEGEKALTLRCAVPLLTDREQSLNKKLRMIPAYKDRNVVVSYDLSVYGELEENKREQVEYLDKAWWFTGNQKLQAMGEPVSDDPLMNEHIIDSNKMLLSDLTADPVIGPDQQANADAQALAKENLEDYK